MRRTRRKHYTSPNRQRSLLDSTQTQRTHESLHCQEEHPHKPMPGLKHSPKVQESINRRSERAIQPPPPLPNPLCTILWHICLRLALLHVREGPFLSLLRNELEAEDTVLGEEHVLVEDGHSVDAAGGAGEGVVAVEVLRERAALEGAEAVGAESSRKDGDVSETAFEGLV